jgi:hypothetical protein
VKGRAKGRAIPRVYLMVGSLLSVTAGLLFALVAFGVVLVLAGKPTDGGYCSEYGIGQYEAETPKEMVVYMDEGWSGLPPSQHCKVYLADATGDSPSLSDEELLREDPPPHLLTEGIYPGTQEYAWIIGALLLPLAIWGLLLAVAKFARRGMTPEA